MGLLDDILGQGQGRGLWNSLYPNTLQPDQQQTDYDALGNPMPKYLTADSPFPTPAPQRASPGLPQLAQQSPIIGGAGTWGIGNYMPATTPQSPAPASDVSSINRAPDRTIDVGGYKMPQFGQAPEPDPAAIPRNAQLAQYLPQQTPARFAATPESPGIGDRLNAGLQGFANAGGPLQALSSLVSGLATGERTDPQGMALQSQRAIYNAVLQQPGMTKDKAFLIATNPKAFEAYASQLLGAKEPPKTVEELAVRNAWEGRNQPANSAAAAAGGSNGLPTTIEGLQEWKAQQEADKAKAKARGEKEGEAKFSLPDTLARAEQTIKQIDELKTHPAKGYRTGFGSVLPAIPGTEGVDFDERVKQLKGGAFLDAYKMLRGTGAISEAEGIKAEQAQARLSQAKNQKDFDTALDDLRAVVVAGYARAQQTAGDQPKAYEMPVGQSRNIGGVTIKRTK